MTTNLRRVLVDARSLLTPLLVLVLLGAFAPDAKAACFDKPLSHGPLSAGGKVPYGGHGSGPSSHDGPDRKGGSDSFVGLWSVNFYIGEGPDLFDVSYQQFHSDGTELNLSGGLSPSLGNVCIGVWKATGPRSIKLRHVAFNWDADGKMRGTFLLLMTLRLNRNGQYYSGKYEADSFDLNGDKIPAEHFEGIVRGTRINVD